MSMKGLPTCGANAKQTKRPCQQIAMPNGRCRLHGGKSLVGPAAPQFTTGRYSKHLPSQLATLYEEAQSDHQLISVRDEIRLVDARTNQVLDRLNSHEAKAHWEQLKDLVQQFHSSDPGKQNQAAKALSEWSTEALSDYAVWAEVLDLMERRRKLAETETKRQAAMGQMITASQAVVLMAQLVDICRRHVTDRNQLSAISRDIATLAEREPD